VARQGVQLYGDRDDVNDNIANVTAGNVHVAMGDSASLDSFSRQRISQPVTILDSILKYDKAPQTWYEQLTGGATSVHQFDEASVLMTVTTSGDKVVRQTRQYLRYQPGKSQLIMMTSNMQSGGDTLNVRRRSGYFDAENGIFAELTSAGIGFVVRSNVTGSVVETRVEQADWNLDTLDELDVTKTHILVIDLQWLGVGRVRVGYVIGGMPVYVHEFNHSNIETSVYMTTAQLPARHEIEATGAPSGASTMRHICTAIITEGGVDEGVVAIPHSVVSGAPASSSGTLIPILSIRPKATYEGEVNRVQIIERALQVINTGNGTAEVHLIWEGALTGAVFASVESDSTMEVDTTATAITGGHSIATFYVPASNQSSAAVETAIKGKLPLTLDIDGLNPTNLTIAITNHGTVVAAASLTWQEFQ
tara:strand:+ start:241 stop:1503 length:1263 start_codon:yes stop_codon:yes gene_type:complete